MLFFLTSLLREATANPLNEQYLCDFYNNYYNSYFTIFNIPYFLVSVNDKILDEKKSSSQKTRENSWLIFFTFVLYRAQQIIKEV